MNRNLNGTGSNQSDYCSDSRTNHDLLQIDDIVGFARFVARRKYQVALGMAVCIGFGLLIYGGSPRAYESEAQLLVERKDPLTLEGVGPRPAFNLGELSAHLKLIKSPWFVDSAIQKHQLATLNSLAKGKNPAKTVISALTVDDELKHDNVASNSTVLRFSFRSPLPAECPIALAAIVKRYQEHLVETNRSGNEDLIRLLKHEVSATGKDLQRKRMAYHTFRKNARTAGDGNGQTRVSEHQLDDVKSKRVDLRVRRVEIESQLASVRTALVEDPIAAARAVPNSFKVEQQQASRTQEKRERQLELLNEKLLPLQAERDLLAKDYGLGYPRLGELEEKIVLTKRLFAVSSADADAGESVHGGEQIANDLVQAYIHSLEQQLKSVAAAERTLDEQIAALSRQLQADAEQAKIAELNELKSKNHADDIARAEQLHETLMTKLKSLDLGNESGGFKTTVISPPKEAVRVAPNTLLIFSVAACMGIVLGLGLGAWAELSDQTFRSPETIRSLGLPVLGQVPALAVSTNGRQSGDSSGLTPERVLCMQQGINSDQAEAYRALRAAVYFSSPGEGIKVIQVASPTDRDGKSTLAANLAVSIAQSGKSVLLVDADLRQPRIHRIFQLAGDCGLGTLVGGEAEPPDVIQPSGIEGLSVLPAGPLPGSPADLLSSPRLAELFHLVRQQFDYVLVDSPPLLRISDARVIAALVDGVLLTIRPTVDDQPSAQRAKEMLEMLDVNIMGVVISGGLSETGNTSGHPRWTARGVNGHRGSNGRRERALAGTSGLDS